MRCLSWQLAPPEATGVGVLSARLALSVAPAAGDPSRPLPAFSPPRLVSCSQNIRETSILLLLSRLEPMTASTLRQLFQK